MQGVGEIGKDETSKNLRKCAKNNVKCSKIFENVQKSECVLSKKWGNLATKTLRHKES